MNRQRQLWILVAANILLAFASAGAEGFFGWTLPPELAAYRHPVFQEFGGMSLGSVLHFVLLAVLTLSAFAAWIGLLASWRHARRLYLACMVMSVVLDLTSGPVVLTSVGAAFRMLDGVVSGVVLGLVYFTDLARRFERAPAARTAPAVLPTT